jgi:hypothetical protein
MTDTSHVNKVNIGEKEPTPEDGEILIIHMESDVDVDPYLNDNGQPFDKGWYYFVCLPVVEGEDQMITSFGPFNSKETAGAAAAAHIRDMMQEEASVLDPASHETAASLEAFSKTQ